MREGKVGRVGDIWEGRKESCESVKGKMGIEE